MGTEVLRPQDCLGERFRVCPPAFQRRRSSSTNGNGFGNGRTNSYGYRRPLNRPERDAKRKPAQQTDVQQFHHSPRRTTSADELQNHLYKPANHQQPPQNGVVDMGRLTILRRGESLDSFETKMKKENMSKRSNRGGITMKKKNMDGGYEDALYAGSAFSVSPAPESLPLPSFFNSNNINNRRCEYEDSATRGLRRLLRLE